MFLRLNQERMDQLTPENISTYVRQSQESLAIESPTITSNTSFIKQTSGPNNYASLAPYYHPDPTSENGFPYIRMDGVINRSNMSSRTSDGMYVSRLCALLTPLCILYYYTKSEDYATRAISIIEKFFINEETKMNPDLTYSGMVIGNSMEDLRIRGATIDIQRLSMMTDLIQLLKTSTNWTIEIENAMVLWFDSLSDWFKTHPRGILQNTYNHNIKTSYVKQLCSYLCFCGKIQEAKNYLEDTVRTMLSAQIDIDGKQVLEMERTRSRHYSNFNLQLLVELAIISNSLGVNIWNYKDENGRGSIQQAMRFMCYYYENPTQWNMSTEEKSAAMTRAWLQFGVKVYKEDQLLADVNNKVSVPNFIWVPDYIAFPS
jgi:hypothetical protein